MAKKNRTPEQKAERKAKSRDKKMAKRAALVAVLNFVKERKNVPDEVLAAVKMVMPGNRVAGTGNRLSTFAKFFTENSSATETKIFETFKAGRAEMRKVCIGLIKKQKPEDRLWVRFDVKQESYIVEGTGPDAPKDWTGYRPVEIEETEVL